MAAAILVNELEVAIKWIATIFESSDKNITKNTLKLLVQLFPITFCKETTSKIPSDIYLMDGWKSLFGTAGWPGIFDCIWEIF